jgi:multicomponent Na+:H+ antiporter subunit B
MIRSFDSLMLRTLQGPLIAALQLLSIYVLLHGHYSPGGGFVAGILLAASMILPRLGTGRPEGRISLSPRGAGVITAVGVLIFAGIGVLPVLFGHQVLDYGALPLHAEPAYRRSLGILLIEIGVTLGVAGAMLSIFYALTRRVGGEAV